MGAQWKAKGKALVADAKGKLFGKLVKEITVAARLGGGDPTGNSRLRMAIEAARKASMPKDTLDRAIKKGSGAGADAVNYSSVIFEGYAPHRVPVMVECLTDNPNRTAPNMRVCFRKGQMTAYPDTNVLVFEKTLSGTSDRFLILVNVRNVASIVQTPETWAGHEAKDELTDHTIKLDSSLTLEPFQYLILKY